MNDTHLSDPTPGLKNYTNRAFIEVSTNSAFFRNIGLYLYFFKDPKTAKVSNISVKLVEVGMGMPGLEPDTLAPMMSMRGDWIVFDLAFTIKAHIAPLEHEGMSIPLPFPSHECNIHGYYNTRTNDQSANFREYGG